MFLTEDFDLLQNENIFVKSKLFLGCTLCTVHCTGRRIRKTGFCFLVLSFLIVTLKFYAAEGLAAMSAFIFMRESSVGDAGNRTGTGVQPL